VQQELLARLHAAASAHEQPLAALRAVFTAHVDFVVEHPGVPRVVFQELQHPEDTPLKARVHALMQGYRALISGLLQQAQAAKLLAPGVDLQAAAVLLLGSVQGLVMQSLISGKVEAMRALAPAVFDLFQQATAAPPVSAPINPESLP
jgi:TetR/AcrR family transcriptional regulator